MFEKQIITHHQDDCARIHNFMTFNNRGHPYISFKTITYVEFLYPNDRLGFVMDWLIGDVIDLTSRNGKQYLSYFRGFTND
jgi:hypothetical protein